MPLEGKRDPSTPFHLKGCLNKEKERQQRKENTKDTTSVPSSCAFYSPFISYSMQTRTFFFLIAKDTSNQFEIKILQLVKQPRQLCSRHRVAENFSSFTRQRFQTRRRRKRKREEFDTFSN